MYLKFEVKEGEIEQETIIRLTPETWVTKSTFPPEEEGGEKRVIFKVTLPMLTVDTVSVPERDLTEIEQSRQRAGKLKDNRKMKIQTINKPLEITIPDEDKMNFKRVQKFYEKQKK